MSKLLMQRVTWRGTVLIGFESVLILSAVLMGTYVRLGAHPFEQGTIALALKVVSVCEPPAPIWNVAVPPAVSETFVFLTYAPPPPPAPELELVTPSAPLPPAPMSSTVLLALFQSLGTVQGEELAEVRKICFFCPLDVPRRRVPFFPFPLSSVTVVVDTLVLSKE